ncbi:MAG TPA: hypothetical protein VLE44_00525 [Candidatus Saccharimonadales bacterium]|nr:hypothetical protein [Candidatus Saccharimonadales bacterium]
MDKLAKIKYRNLIDFEDSIRLEATPLSEFMKSVDTSSPTYIVGSKVSDYLPTLRNLGFNDMWQVLTSDKENFTKHVNKIKINKKTDEGTSYMYAYIDYVLKKPDTNLVVFLPNKTGILAEGNRLEVPYPTYDEITRILKHFQGHSKRIHFVTGLFALSPKEFDQKYNLQKEPVELQQI